MPLEIDPKLLAEATEAELAIYEQLLEEEVALQSPADYAEFVEGLGGSGADAFNRYDHVELISKTFADLCEGRLLKPDGTPYRKMMLFIPPQHGKSQTVSKRGVAWFLSKYPSKRAILASFEHDWAAKWGRDARDLGESEKGRRLMHIRRDVRSTDAWETEEGGGMYCAGARGPITGKSADLFIIDDPYKDNVDANSELIRQRTDDWYQSVVLSRLQKNGILVLIQTRWHDDDLGGRLLAREADDWYVLTLPLFATGEAKDPLGRRPGEILCPDLHPAEEMEIIRKNVSPYWWSAMYQQDPQVAGGDIFRSDTFRYYTENDEHYVLHVPNAGSIYRKKKEEYRRFIAVDTAVTDHNYSDYTVLLVGVITPQKELLVLHVQRLRIKSGKHQELLEAAKKRWNPDYFAVEETAPSMSLIQLLKRKLIPVKALKTRGEHKTSRAMTAQELLEAGRVYFPREAAWLPEFEKELLIFDKGKHDDQVDAFVYACLELAKVQRVPTPPKKREPQTFEEKAWAMIKERQEGNRFHDSLGDW